MFDALRVASTVKAYLNHPKHEKAGELFYALSEAGLVYDYEMISPANFIPLRS